MNKPKTIIRYDLKKEKSDFEQIKIVSSRQAYDYIMQFYGEDIEVYESAFLLLLNRAAKTIGYVKISQGGICGTVIDTLLVAKYAIDSLAKSVVIAHNHPSGNLLPSAVDNESTKNIKDALKLFGIQLNDHLIVTTDGYYSYADKNDL
jgi:DNA repair protein RadC